jgi:fructose-1,6-bisphosphatase/sedoheptulose 1,7-bisphosphatase-like protein
MKKVKTMFIMTAKEYDALINNKLGLKGYDKVYFSKTGINKPTLIKGIEFCEEVGIEWVM